ncbi:MAG: DinB family protein [Dehalococcoidia bacterium]
MLPQVEELLDKLESHRRELLEVLSGMSEEEASRHPGGEWSAKQQVAHLVHAEPVWLDWAQAIQNTPGISLGQTLEEGQIFLRDVDDADSKPLTWWLERLQETRTETLRHLQELDLATEEALSKKGTHRTFGEMNVLQALRANYRHHRMHIDQMQGREQSFVPRQQSGDSG